jgi:membrane protease YdiL (CAAX protease family)
MFKARDSEHHRLNGLNSIRTILLLSMTITIVFASNFILVQIFRIFDVIPKSGYNNILLNPGHLNNPLNILIFYLPITIGAPFYEELVYRRLLIPLFEERGMTPIVAVVTSSFIFAIAHLPGDLVNGNLPGGVIHVWNVFLIGMSVGLIYVLTRNIIYPIIIHGVLNFISFSGPIVLLMGNNLMNLIYYIAYLFILSLGVGVFLFSLWQYFRNRDTEWIELIKKKNHNNIKYGILTFSIIGTTGAFLPLIIRVILLELAIYDVLQYTLISICCFGSLIILFLWLGTKTTYDSIGNQNLK